MEKIILYCDRCGKECEETRHNRGYHLFRNKFYIRKSTDKEYLDLCQSCYDSLAKWVKEGKGNNK